MRAAPVIGLLLVAGVLAAQEPRFEVASLKRNTSGSSSTTMDNRPDGLVMENGTLRNLIFNAYSGLTGYYQITLRFAADVAADAGDAPTPVGAVK